MPTRDLTSSLIAAFKATDLRPTWAWNFPPSIPLIGARFVPGESLLIYASAENLTLIESDQSKPYRHFFEGELAWNRYRHQFDDSALNAGRFFPWVGIQPFMDGGLPCAAYFVSEHLGLPLDDQPRAFVEHLAVTNWGKFTVRAQTNKDYAGNRELLEASLPLVVSELEQLQPGVVLVPRSVWSHKGLQDAMRAASPSSRFLPIAQFNSTVVNTHLRKHAARAAELQRAHDGSTLGHWMQNLQRFNLNNAWRYPADLEAGLAANVPD